jgi:hypothetical protein
VSLSPDLAADLAAAYLDRANIHNDQCGDGCSCGVDSLLTKLVDELLPGFSTAARRLGLEGRPFWPEDHPGLLPLPVAASAA